MNEHVLLAVQNVLRFVTEVSFCDEINHMYVWIASQTTVFFCFSSLFYRTPRDAVIKNEKLSLEVCR